MDQKYFTLIRKDVLDNPDLSLNAKRLYCLICYDLIKTLRGLLLNKKSGEQTINNFKKIVKNNYADFYIDFNNNY